MKQEESGPEVRAGREERKGNGEDISSRDICIFLYQALGDSKTKENAHTSKKHSRAEWGIKYPWNDRKACDIIFVADRQLGALSLCELCRCIVFRPFFMGPESSAVRQ